MFSSLLVASEKKTNASALDLALSHIREQFPGDLTPRSILKLGSYWQFINPFPAEFDSYSDNPHIRFLHYIGDQKPAMLVDLLVQDPEKASANCSVALHLLVRKARIVFISGFFCQLRISGIKIAIANLDPLEPLKRFSLMQAQQSAEMRLGSIASRYSEKMSSVSSRRTSLMRKDTIDHYKNVSNCLFALYVASYCASQPAVHNLSFWLRFGGGPSASPTKSDAWLTLILHFLGRDTQLFCDIIESVSSEDGFLFFRDLPLESLVQEHIHQYCNQEMLSQIKSNSAFAKLFPAVNIQSHSIVTDGIVFTADDLVSGPSQKEHEKIVYKTLQYSSGGDLSHYVFEMLKEASGYFTNQQLHIDDFSFLERLCGLIEVVQGAHQGLPGKAFKGHCGSDSHRSAFVSLHPGAKFIAAILAGDIKEVFSTLCVNAALYMAIKNSSLTLLNQWAGDAFKIDLLMAFLQAYVSISEKDIIAALNGEALKAIFSDVSGNVSIVATAAKVSSLSRDLISSNRLNLFRYVHHDMGLQKNSDAADYDADYQLYEKAFSVLWRAPLVGFEEYLFFRDHPAFKASAQKYIQDSLDKVMQARLTSNAFEEFLQLSPCCLVYEYYINGNLRNKLTSISGVVPIAYHAKSLSLRAFLLRQELLMVDLDHLQYLLRAFLLSPKKTSIVRGVKVYLDALRAAYNRIKDGSRVQAYNAIFHPDNSRVVHNLFFLSQEGEEEVLAWFGDEANRESLDCFYSLIKAMAEKEAQPPQVFKAAMQQARVALLARVAAALANQCRLVLTSVPEEEKKDIVCMEYTSAQASNTGRKNEHQLNSLIVVYQKLGKLAELDYVKDILQRLLQMSYFSDGVVGGARFNRYAVKYILERCIKQAELTEGQEGRNRFVSVDVVDEKSAVEAFCEKYLYRESSFCESRLLALMQGEEFDRDYQDLFLGSCSHDFVVRELSLFLISEKCFLAYQYMVSVKGMAPRQAAVIDEEEVNCYRRAFEMLMTREVLPVGLYAFYSINESFSVIKDEIAEKLIKYGPEKYPLAYIYEFYLNETFRRMAGEKYKNQYKTPLTEQAYSRLVLKDILRFFPSIDLHSLMVLLGRHLENSFDESHLKMLRDAYERHMASLRGGADAFSLSLRAAFSAKGANAIFRLFNTPIFNLCIDQVLSVASKELLELYFQIKLKIVTNDPLYKKNFISMMVRFRYRIFRLVVNVLDKKHDEITRTLRPGHREEDFILRIYRIETDPKRHLGEMVKDAIEHDDLASLSYMQSLLRELLAMKFFYYNVGCKKADALAPYLQNILMSINGKLEAIGVEAGGAVVVADDSLDGKSSVTVSAAAKDKSPFRRFFHISGDNEKAKRQFGFFSRARAASASEAADARNDGRKESGNAEAGNGAVASAVSLSRDC